MPLHTISPAAARSYALIAAAFCTAAPCAAQSYNFTSRPASTFTGNFGVTANFAGSLIGDYDVTTNAVGTRTITGTFGTVPAAPANQRIAPIAVVASSSGALATSPIGSYVLVLNQPALTVTLAGLTINLLGAQQPQFPVNTQFSYPGFRTRTPNYTYFFLAPIPIAVGNATVTSLSAAQVSAVTAAVTPSGNSFNFSTTVPMAFAVIADVQGAPSAAILPQQVTVTGSVNPSAGTATLSFSQSGTEPIPAQPAEPAPPPVPFALPPPPFSGGTVNANVLLTLLLTGGSTTLNGTTTLPSTGVLSSLADIVGGDGNPPADGSVDGNDFQAFLNAFSASSALADLVGGDGNPPADGSVDGNDFQAFLNAFAAG